MLNRFNRLIQISHSLYLLGGLARPLSQILQRFLRLYYFCDISPVADYKGVYFCHKCFGIVVNFPAVIGEGTYIQHSVTIGIREGGIGTQNREKLLYRM